MFYLTPIPQSEMGKIMLWTGQRSYNHVKIVCVTCLNILKMGVWTGPCITNVFATRRKNFSQWHRSFQRKLLSHWLKFLRHVAITLVIQGPGAMKSLGRTLLNGIHHSYSVAAHWFGETHCCCSPELPLLKWSQGMRMRLTGKWQQLILLVISLGNRCKIYVCKQVYNLCM